MMNRRQALSRALSFGSLPLQSLITGLPVSFLAGLVNPLAAMDLTPKKYTILSHQSDGDPINTNAPGTYAADASDPLAGVEHPEVDGFAEPTEFLLGDVPVRAAQPWADLDVDLRSRLAFWHHNTLNSAHADFRFVRRFNGAIKGTDGTGGDELASMLAQESQASLNTLTKGVMSVGGSSIEFSNTPVPILRPSDIKNLFGSNLNQIDQMIALRDRYIDKAYAAVKAGGTPAQKAFLEKYALSRQEALAVGNNLGALLTDVTNNNTSQDEIRVAVALIQLNIAPVITLGVKFGGDNHGDSNLSREVEQTTQAIADINFLWQSLKAAQLQDKVVFATLNTFGRILKRNENGGRNHAALHHTMLVFGDTIKPSVVGGLGTLGAGKEFYAAQAFNATTGNLLNPDVPANESLSAVGKTLAKVVGISDEVIEKRITGGKVITASLV